MTQQNQRRLTTRSLWTPTVVAGLVILIALTFNVLGIYVMSGLSAWQEWRTHWYWHFFAWRVALYCVALGVWLLYRNQLLQHESPSKKGVRRIEMGVFLSLLLIELLRALLRQGV
ncbi:hypothetical protein JYG35_18420 [Pseudomonas rhodesiae]|uniref:hypothetical protein n=1 Tax=Pseudomonas rhodesiae TaxID=76760 RepID=UPI001BCEC0B7|nr:hypothetical protein [Pseudomonas rhodesiae]QVN05608.1 hypothetical protein JYG35_18420 [Pseudomonas rhodesiae]